MSQRISNIETDCSTQIHKLQPYCSVPLQWSTENAGVIKFVSFKIMKQSNFRYKDCPSPAVNTKSQHCLIPSFFPSLHAVLLTLFDKTNPLLRDQTSCWARDEAQNLKRLEHEIMCCLVKAVAHWWVWSNEGMVNRGKPNELGKNAALDPFLPVWISHDMKSQHIASKLWTT